MLKIMRDIAPVMMWIVISAFVGTIFFSWGMGGAARKGVNRNVAIVDGKSIPIEQFSRGVENQREMYRKQKDGDLSAEESRIVPKQVLENEISRILLKEVFEKMNLSGSVNEIFDYLSKNPPPAFLQSESFRTETGQFDTSRYVQYLNTPESFNDKGMVNLENYTRTMIIPMEKLRRLLEMGKEPSKSEIEYEYHLMKDKAQFEYAKVLKLNFKPAESELSDEAVNNFYSANQDSFKTENQRDLYYLKIEKVATASDREVYLSELKEIKASIIANKSTFAEEAKSESDDLGSAVNGGDLGWFEKGKMVKEFDNTVFAMTPGTISDPVESPFGYHLIYLDSISSDGKSVKASHILRIIEPSSETLDSLESYMDDMHDKMITAGFKATVEATEGVELKSTGIFTHGSNIGELGYVSGAIRYAFDNSKEKEPVSAVLENRTGYYIVSVKTKVKAGTLPFEYAKKKAKKLLSKSLSDKKAFEYLDKIRSTISAGASIATLAEGDSIIISGVTDTVTQRQYINKDISYQTSAIAVAYSIPVNTISKVIDDKDAVYLVKPLYRIVADVDFETPEIMRIKEKLIASEKKSAYQQWYMAYKSQAKISNNLDKFYE